MFEKNSANIRSAGKISETHAELHAEMNACTFDGIGKADVPTFFGALPSRRVHSIILPQQAIDTVQYVVNSATATLIIS